jgi:hypothetical protein
MHGYNPADEKVPKGMKIKACYNVGHGFSDFSGHAESLGDNRLFLNSLPGFIDFISLLQVP